jgi:hypothetical protein
VPDVDESYESCTCTVLEITVDSWLMSAANDFPHSASWRLHDMTGELTFVAAIKPGPRPRHMRTSSRCMLRRRAWWTHCSSQPIGTTRTTLRTLLPALIRLISMGPPASLRAQSDLRCWLRVF